MKQTNEDIDLVKAINSYNRQARNNALEQSIKIITIFIGVSTLILGIIFSILIIFDYKSFHDGSIRFENGNDIANLGSLLSGTVGVLFAVSGVCFFIITIIQNKTEMELTRNIFKTQLAESTFFNLLKNHREIIENFEIEKEGDPLTRPQTLSKIIIRFKKDYNLYRRSLSNKYFSSFRSTTNSPQNLLKSNYTIKTVSNSIIHIINLIEDNFNNEKTFYHTTLYNNLSLSEKYLIGCLVRNGLTPKPFYPFNYSEEYDNTIEKLESKNTYFPPIAMLPFTSLSSLHKNLSSNNIELKDNLKQVTGFKLYFHDKNTKLEKIICQLFFRKGIERIEINNMDLDIVNGECNLWDIIELAFIKNRTTEVSIKFKFYFSYNNTTFTIDENKTTNIAIGYYPNGINYFRKFDTEEVANLNDKSFMFLVSSNE